MKFAKKLSLALSLAAAIACSAQAQDAKLKVMLPHDVQIGEALLPAGQYTIALTMNGVATATIAPADHKGSSVFVLPISTDEYATCKQSSVSMQREGADWSVRSICFAEPQIALSFAAPAAKVAVATAAPAPTVMAGR